MKDQEVRSSFSLLLFGLNTVLFFAKIVPFRLFRTVSFGLMAMFYAVAGRKLRRVALESLDLAWGDELSPAEKGRIADEAYFNLVQGFIGHVYSASHPELTDEVFEIEGREAVDAALKQGKGAVFAVAHFGPFTWMLLKFVRCGWRVNVVMRPSRDIAVGRRLQSASAKSGLNLIPSVPLRECVIKCRELLARGEVVVLPVDQNYGGPGRVFVDFFGRLAGTATGPAVFAAKTGAPLFFAYALPRTVDIKAEAFDHEHYLVKISEQIHLEPGADDRKALVATTALLTKKVEALAMRYPEQWSWMHRRWKAVPRKGEI